MSTLFTFLPVFEGWLTPHSSVRSEQASCPGVVSRPPVPVRRAWVSVPAGVSHPKSISRQATPAAAMGVERVAQLSLEHISALLPRLERYGAYGLHTRSLLRLLLSRINTAPFEIFAVGGDAPDAAVVTVTHLTRQLATLDVCARDDPASQRRLEGLLRAPQLSGLWRSSLRAEGVNAGLAPLLAAVAADHGMRTSFGDERRLFARHPRLPCLTGSVPRAGVDVRPLLQRHLAALRRHRRPASTHADAHFSEDPADTRLSAGVFTSATSGDTPAAWAMVNRQGVLRFGESGAADRDGDLQRLALAEMARLCQHLDLPCISSVPDTHLEAFRDLMRLDFISAHSVIGAHFEPEMTAAHSVENEQLSMAMHVA